ncbi:hypothetical protein VTL71DRAFT_2163 [Oculimacula yallundae]|uniref:Uncharacterized protein n=1 Tax=Oculimacula yallundae TaxID=86028 RepID=A0ABR4C992_9HELO
MMVLVARSQKSKSKMSPNADPNILVPGTQPGDALPDLSALHTSELKWYYDRRWEAERKIDHSNLKGQHQWCWIVEQFVELYNGADLNIDRTFIMFQVHLAFADRNESAPKPFKFLLIEAYDNLTARNSNVAGFYQDWKIDLEKLRIWVLEHKKALEDDMKQLKEQIGLQEIKSVSLSPDNPVNAAQSIEQAQPHVAPSSQRPIKAASKTQSAGSFTGARGSSSSAAPKKFRPATRAVSKHATIMVDHPLDYENRHQSPVDGKGGMNGSNGRKRAREEVTEGGDEEATKKARVSSKTPKTFAEPTRRSTRIKNGNVFGEQFGGGNGNSGL